MNASETTKFAFETEFAADGTILRDGEAWRISFTPEEVQAERDKAFAEGKQDALVKAEEEAAIHLLTLTQQCQSVLSGLKTQSEECRSQALELVLIAARKIAGVALECYPDEQVQNTVLDVIKDLRGVPRLVLTCSADASPQFEVNLKEMAAKNDFDGELVIRRAQDAEPGDIRLEWAQGEVCINTNDIADRVETTVRNWLAATEAQDAQGDLFAQQNSIEEGQ